MLSDAAAEYCLELVWFPDVKRHLFTAMSSLFTVPRILSFGKGMVLANGLG